MQKLEEKEGAVGGLSHGIRKRLHLSWACVLRRVVWEGYGQDKGSGTGSCGRAHRTPSELL